MKPRIIWTRLVTMMSCVIVLSLGWQGGSASSVVFAQPSSSAAEIQAFTGNGSMPQSIGSISDFLEQCPDTDPIYAQLRSDIKLRRNNVLVGNIPCTAPISTMPIAQYTDELITMQVLRTMYYMDLGRSGHLPWTGGTLYAWLISKVDGIDLSDTAVTSTCCYVYGDGTYMIVKTQNDSNRDFDRKWNGIEGNFSLIMHEARHADGFAHDSVCGIPNGCDPTYNESNLGSYGIQWWLEKSWLNGDIPVGVSCDDVTEMNEILNLHRITANSIRNRFSSNPPPVLSLPQFSCPSAVTQTAWTNSGVPSPGPDDYIYYQSDIVNQSTIVDGVIVTVTSPNQLLFVYADTTVGSVSGVGTDTLVFDLGTVPYNNYPITLYFTLVVPTDMTSPTALLGASTLTWTGGANSSINYGVIANALQVYLPLVLR